VFSFVAGLSGISLLTWGAMLGGISFEVFSVSMQWALGVFFAVAAILDVRRPVADNAPAMPATAVGPYIQRALAAVAIVLAVVALIQSPRFDYHQDSFDHIGYVRHIAEENSLSPHGVLAPPVEAPEGGAKADPRKGTFQPVAALAARMAGVDPIDAWRVMPAVFFPVAFLAFVWFCAAFLPDRRLVLACAALFLLFQGGTGVLHGREFANGQGIWLVFYWTLVPLCLRYAVSGARRNLSAVLVLLAGGAFMHVGVLTHAAVLLASLLLFYRWLRLDRQAVLTLCAWGAGIAAVALVWKVATSIGGGNQIHAHPQGLMYVGGGMFVASPVEVLRQNGLVFFGGLVMLPFLVLAARRHGEAKLQIAFAAIPIAVCFIPPLVVLLYQSATYMVFRTLLNVPAFAIVAASVYWLASWSRRRAWWTRAAAALALLVWAWLFLAPSIGAFDRAFDAGLARRDAEPLMERYDDLIRYMRSRPDDSVVLTDPKTSYLLSAATDHQFVAILEQHGNPNDPFAFDRLTAVRDVLSPFVFLSEAAAACERYGVDFVVVNGRLRDSAPGFLFDWSPALYPQTRKKLSALETRFRPLFEDGDITVYLYYPGSIPPDVWIPEDTPLDFGVSGLRNCTIRSPGDEFYISQVAVSPGRVLPGETVKVSLGYELSDGLAYGLPFIVHIRFDHESIAGDVEGYPMDKHVRRLRERRSGHKLRFRFDHRPFGGLLAADRWPAAVMFYESFPVKLSSTLEPGRYTVDISIARETRLPNFELRDFVFNQDHYSGTRCMQIEVTRQLER